MSIEGFAERLALLVRRGALSTNQARVLCRAVEAADVRDDEALTQIYDSIAWNCLSGDQLNAIIERAPRFADTVRVGLRPLFGDVTPKRLQELARHGHLTTSVIERALSRDRPSTSMDKT